MMKIRLVLPILIILLVSSASLAAEFNSLVTFTKSWKDKDRTDFLEGRLPISVLDYLDKIYKNPHISIWSMNWEQNFTFKLLAPSIYMKLVGIN